MWAFGCIQCNGSVQNLICESEKYFMFIFCISLNLYTLFKCVAESIHKVAALLNEQFMEYWVLVCVPCIVWACLTCHFSLNKQCGSFLPLLCNQPMTPFFKLKWMTKSQKRRHREEVDSLDQGEQLYSSGLIHNHIQPCSSFLGLWILLMWKSS